MSEPFERQRKFNIEYVNGARRENVDGIVMRERKDLNEALVYIIDTGEINYFRVLPITEDRELSEISKEPQ